MMQKRGVILCAFLSLSGTVMQAEMKLQKNEVSRLGGTVLTGGTVDVIQEVINVNETTSLIGDSAKETNITGSDVVISSSSGNTMVTSSTATTVTVDQGNGPGTETQVLVHGSDGQGATRSACVKTRAGVSTSGGDVSVEGGIGVSDGNGGTVTILGGVAQGAGSDGNIHIKTGAASFTANLSDGDIGLKASGVTYLEGAFDVTNATGLSGSISCLSSDDGSAEEDGGTVCIESGSGGDTVTAGNNGGEGGLINLLGGAGGASLVDNGNGGKGSTIIIKSGNGGAAKAEVAEFQSSLGGDGGDLTIEGGQAGSGGNGGLPGDGGLVTVRGGAGGSSDYGQARPGGNVEIVGGTGGNTTADGNNPGNGGNVLIKSGVPGTGGNNAAGTGKIEIVSHGQVTSASDINQDIGVAAQGSLYLKAGLGIQLESTLSGSTINTTTLSSLDDENKELDIKTQDFSEDNSEGDGIKLNVIAGNNTRTGTADIKGGGIRVLAGRCTDEDSVTTGGSIYMEAGRGRVGGDVSILGGEALIAAGSVMISGGKSDNDKGGAVTITTGNGYPAGNLNLAVGENSANSPQSGANIILTAGTGGTGGEEGQPGGNIELVTGAAGGSSISDGDVIVKKGSSEASVQYALIALLRRLVASNGIVINSSANGTYPAKLAQFGVDGVAILPEFGASNHSLTLTHDYDTDAITVTEVEGDIENISGPLTIGNTITFEVVFEGDSDMVSLEWNSNGTLIATVSPFAA